MHPYVPGSHNAPEQPVAGKSARASSSNGPARKAATLGSPPASASAIVTARKKRSKKKPTASNLNTSQPEPLVEATGTARHLDLQQDGGVTLPVSPAGLTDRVAAQAAPTENLQAVS